MSGGLMSCGLKSYDRQYHCGVMQIGVNGENCIMPSEQRLSYSHLSGRHHDGYTSILTGK